MSALRPFLFAGLVAASGLACSARAADPLAPLLKGLKSNDAAVREDAVKGIVEACPPASGAVPALVEALGDPEPRVREAAAQALAHLRSDRGRCGRALVKHADKLDPGVLFAALRRLKPRDEEVFRFCVASLRSKDPSRRADAVRTLGVLAPYADDRLRAEAVKALLAVLKERSIPASLIGEVLDSVRPPGDAERAKVAALAAEVADKNPAVRFRAIDGLAKLGPRSQAAVPALEKSLKDPSAKLRYAAAVALAGIDEEAAVKYALPVLVEALKYREVFPGDEDPEDVGYRVRRPAAAALGRLGPPAATALPALNEALKDKDGEVRKNAAAALKEICPGFQAP